MPKVIHFRELHTTVDTWRLNGNAFYDGPRKVSGKQIRVECTKCGDTSRIISVGMWNSMKKGTHRLACWHCKPDSSAGKRRRTGITLTYNGQTKTLVEWAEYTDQAQSNLYYRHKEDQKRPEELRKGPQYVIYGLRDKDHPLADFDERPLKAIEREVEKMEEEIRLELQAFLQTQLTLIAERVAKKRLRPLLYELLKNRAMPLPSTTPERQAVKPVTVTANPETDTDAGPTNTGLVWAQHPKAEPGATHDPNFHHPHDHEPFALKCTMLQYRQQFGDARVFAPFLEGGRWEAFIDARDRMARLESGEVLDEATRKDSEFALIQYQEMLNEPVWLEDIAALQLEEEERLAAEQAERDRERQEKERLQREAQAAEDAKWTITCLEQDWPYLQHIATEFVLPPYLRIENGALPVSRMDNSIRDGSFLAPQHETQPLTPEEENYYLSYRWWKDRLRRPEMDYSGNFNYLCRTQYERIVAFHRNKPSNNALYSMQYVVNPDADWMPTHRDLNLYLDLEAIKHYLGAPANNGITAVNKNNIGYYAARHILEDANQSQVLARMDEAVEAGLNHPGDPMWQLADLVKQMVEHVRKRLQLPEDDYKAWRDQQFGL